MKFGKVATGELSSIDFSLPKDHPENVSVLSKTKVGGTNIHVGCAKWGRKEWVNLIYPSGTKDKDFLDEYVRNFNGIEMNTTFYAIKKSNVESWASRAPDGFKFSPKMSRNISHIKRLNDDAKRYTDYFLDSALAFGKKLGPSFLQLPESFSGKYLDRLDDYLQYIPNDFSLFVEFRHEDWLLEGQVFDESFQLLSEHGVGAVITDVAGRRDAIHQRLTIPKAFVRFNGYNLHKSDYERLDQWAEKICQWMDDGLEELYFYLHQEDEVHTPVSADYLINRLNELKNLNLMRPQFVKSNDGSKP